RNPARAPPRGAEARRNAARAVQGIGQRVGFLKDNASEATAAPSGASTDQQNGRPQRSDSTERVHGSAVRRPVGGRMRISSPIPKPPNIAVCSTRGAFVSSE